MRPAEDQCVHVMCPFIGVDRFEIHNMADDVIFVRDTVAAVHVTRGARDIKRLAA